MRRSMLSLVLLAVSAGAAAEWAEIGADQIRTSYADSATLSKAGDIVKMWDLMDFKAVQSRPYGTPFLSQKRQQEYDCGNRRTRAVELVRYSENMGQGDEAPAEVDAEKWEPIAPGTAGEVLWKFACGTR